MIINKAYIRAFKSIYELAISFNPKINVIIGANESGKTNILKAIESFRNDIPFDSSLTCQYSNHYYMGKCPELILEFGGISKENRKALLKISEIFKEIETFQVRRDGSELKDYHLIINEAEIEENIDMKRCFKFCRKSLISVKFPC